MRKLMLAGVMAGLASLTVLSAHAVDQSVQVCAGTSSVSDSTWTFRAGVSDWTSELRGVPPDVTVSTEGTHCSFATSYPLGSEQLGNTPGLAFSKLSLQGSGDFSCANGGNGTLSSPPLDYQSQTNLLDFSAYGGTGGLYAYVVWSASFVGGVGQLTGTLYGYQPWQTEPEPVQGVITVNCADPSGGSVANTTSVLTMPTKPHQQSPGPGIGEGGYHGCVATAGYSCRFEGNGGIPNGEVSGVVAATSGSWAVTHQVGSTTVTDVSGTGPNVFPWIFDAYVVYTLTVGTDGAGAVTAGSPR